MEDHQLNPDSPVVQRVLKLRKKMKEQGENLTISPEQQAHLRTQKPAIFPDFPTIQEEIPEKKQD